MENKTDSCPNCKGNGYILKFNLIRGMEPYVCRLCNGDGVVKVQPMKRAKHG